MEIYENLVLKYLIEKDLSKNDKNKNVNSKESDHPFEDLVVNDEEINFQDEKTQDQSSQQLTKTDQIAEEDPNIEDPIIGQQPDQMIETDPEEVLDNLARIYQLKKINARLLTAEQFIRYFSDPKYDDLKEKMMKAIELFKIVVDNYNTVSDRLDDIIHSYERFLIDVAKELDKISDKELRS